MALVIPSIFTAVDRFSAPMRAMGSAAQSFASKAEGAVQRADRAMNKYTSVLNHAQKEMLGLFSAAAIGAGLIETLDYGFEGIKLYDKAITGLQANFRLTDAALIPFRQSINQTAKDSYIGADKIASVYDVIGSKNRALINQPEVMAEIAKNSVTLSEAWNSELIPTTQSLVGIMAGFKLTDSARTIDILAGASSVGAIKGNDLAMALSSVASEAAHAHVSLSQTAGILEFVDAKTNIGAEGAAAFAKSLLKLEAVGISYKNSLGQFDVTTAITNIRARLDRMPSELAKNDFLAKIFGARTVGKIRPLFDKGSTAELAAYVKSIEQEGIAEQMAAKNTATLDKAIERLKGSFVNALVESNKTNIALNILKGTFTFLYKNMDAVLNVVGALVGAFIAWKAIVITTTILTNAIAFATKGWAIATNLMQAAQWGLNAALAANPIGLVIVAVAALAVLMYESIKHWDEWGRTVIAVSTIILPFFAIATTAVKTFLDHFDDIKASFQNGGIIGGIKAIGRTIEDFMLKPINLVMQAASHLPAFLGGNLAAKGVASIAEMRASMAADEEKQPVKPIINPERNRQEALIQRIDSTQKQNVKVTFDNMPHGVNVTSDSDMVPIVTTRTMAQGFNILNAAGI